MPVFEPQTPIRQDGLTLFELLIVIAIILILIAIALPNFLEAQIRAKVANAKVNARTIANAMESYIVDFKQYPMDHDPDDDSQQGLWQLTTPLKYLTAISVEPFARASGLIDPQKDPFGWEMGSTGQGRLSPSTSRPPPKINAFALWSFGPDFLDNFPSSDTWPLCSLQNVADPCADGPGTAWTDYNPTNGTRSAGDIMQLGGELNTGHYCINGWQRVKGRFVGPT